MKILTLSLLLTFTSCTEFLGSSNPIVMKSESSGSINPESSVFSGENIALEKSVMASSTEQDFLSTLIVDGEKNSDSRFWSPVSAEVSNGDEWIEIDLDDTYKIRGISIFQNNNSVLNLVHRKSDADDWESASLPLSSDIVGRHLRFECAASAEFCQIREIEVYGELTTAIDTVSPVITLKGLPLILLEYGKSYIEAGANALDNYDGDLTSQISLTGSVNSNTAGDYSIIYQVADAAGNSAEVKRSVRVLKMAIQKDTTAPTIELKGSAQKQLYKDEKYLEEGVVAIDDTDGNISQLVKISGKVLTSAVGSYTLTYSVSDAAGNTSRSITRKVDVVAKPSKPILNGIANFTMKAEEKIIKKITYQDQNGEVKKVEVTGVPFSRILTQSKSEATIEFWPREHQVGNHKVVIKVIDDENLSETKDFNLTVATSIVSEPTPTPSPSPENGKQVEVSYSSAYGNGQTIGYLEYLPQSYDQNRTSGFPLLISLHGLGWRGDGDTPQFWRLKKGSHVAKLVEAGKHFPFILISPQQPKNLKGRYSGRSDWDPKIAKEVLDRVLSQRNVDTSRIYITGVSMGGGGVWLFLKEYGDLIAAAAPVCGTKKISSSSDACKRNVKDTPIWALHNIDDSTVRSSSTNSIINMIRNCSEKGLYEPKMTMYAWSGHNSWDSTYSGEGKPLTSRDVDSDKKALAPMTPYGKNFNSDYDDIFDWLLSHQL